MGGVKTAILVDVAKATVSPLEEVRTDFGNWTPMRNRVVRDTRTNYYAPVSFIRFDAFNPTHRELLVTGAARILDGHLLYLRRYAHGRDDGEEAGERH